MLAVLVLALVSLSSAKTLWHQLDNYSFEDYEKEFNKIYQNDQERALRRQLFEQNLKEIKEHNSNNDQTWKKGVNHLTDRTETELKQMRGSKGGDRRRRPSYEFSGASAEQLKVWEANEIDWRTKGAVTAVKNQGECGSCWTFASAETLESWWFLAGHSLPVLSEQQIVDCTPNPNHCGGTGGCNGGTPELAYDRIIEMGGLASEQNYPYTAKDGTCKFSGNTTSPAATLRAWVDLPPNDYASVMTAIQRGPLAINVDASAWHAYESGVMSCNMTSPDIDHVVQLVGYGTDTTTGALYWLVRNSWSSLWGEEGYVRLARFTSDDPCGEDMTPQDGTGCSGGSSEVLVCGSCGILYDVTFPVI